jgi:hypothetical protein
MGKWLRSIFYLRDGYKTFISCAILLIAGLWLKLDAGFMLIIGFFLLIWCSTTDYKSLKEDAKRSFTREYHSLSDDIPDDNDTVSHKPETLFVSEKALLSAIAYWGVAQCPTVYPRKLSTVLYKMYEIVCKEFTELPDFEGFHHRYFKDWKELKDWLYGTLYKIPEFVDWNLSEEEIKAGIKVDDESREGYVFTSAYNTIPSQHDFIDLDACIQNIVSTLERSDI